MTSPGHLDCCPHATPGHHRPADRAWGRCWRPAEADLLGAEAAWPDWPATGWSIKKFVRTARRYRTIEIQVGAHTITAADLLPDDLHDILCKIHT
jgi:hypothetical protein